MSISSHNACRVLKGRYRLERELGRGGMATVHLAEDLRHSSKVAVKILHPEVAGLTGIEQFLYEIRVTAGLRHPNILPLLDSGTCDGLPFYVMPYKSCNSLYHSRHRGKQGRVADVFPIVRDVAAALDYSHAQEIIHLDIKPENILLSQGHAYVGDFGIARAVCERCLPEEGYSSFGTPEYMSPEQASGSRKLDGRSDIYSLSAVTYELLAGAPPFRGITAEAVLFHQVTSQPVSLRRLRPDLPFPIERAVMQGLSKMPADRPGSAGELAGAFERVMQSRAAGRLQMDQATEWKPRHLLPRLDADLTHP